MVVGSSWYKAWVGSNPSTLFTKLQLLLLEHRGISAVPSWSALGRREGDVFSLILGSLLLRRFDLQNGHHFSKSYHVH